MRRADINKTDNYVLMSRIEGNNIINIKKIKELIEAEPEFINPTGNIASNILAFSSEGKEYYRVYVNNYVNIINRFPYKNSSKFTLKQQNKITGMKSEIEELNEQIFRLFLMDPKNSLEMITFLTKMANFKVRELFTYVYLKSSTEQKLNLIIWKFESAFFLLDDAIKNNLKEPAEKIATAIASTIDFIESYESNEQLKIIEQIKHEALNLAIAKNNVSVIEELTYLEKTKQLKKIK